jgi:diadenosine tetraphosphate (Ap4A) HIT family hydrolase
MSQPKHCDFCDEFAGGIRNEFVKRYHSQVWNRSVASTQNFTVLPSLGQIAEGHLLIVPKEHCWSLADVCVTHGDELESLVSRVRRILIAAYGSCVAFEHGARSADGGCGIAHAHLHFVPVANDQIFIERLRERHKLVRVRRLAEVDTHVQGSPYIYVETISGQRYVSAVGGIPSQYLRRCLAEAVGKISWDWRQAGMEESLVTCCNRLSQAFADAVREHGSA